MGLFNLAAIFVSLVITMSIAAFRGHWTEFALLLGLSFSAGFAFYMTLISL